MQRLPPLNAIRAFEAAARHLSFNRAAEELHVTPSAISHQVRTLEEFLGVSLFRRHSRSVSLTADGESLLPPVHGALESIAAATARLTARRRTGPLTMSVAPAFASGWLVPRLPGFQVEHPDVEVRLISSVNLVDFGASDVDLAVRYGNGQWPGLVSHRLLAEELLPVCSPALLKGDHALRVPADLAHTTLLHVLPRLGEWRQWLRAAGVEGVDPERGPKFESSALALEAAVAGLGVVMADRSLAARELDAGRLVTPFESIAMPHGDHAYWLVYPQSSRDDPRIGAFRDWMLGELWDREETPGQAERIS